MEKRNRIRVGLTTAAIGLALLFGAGSPAGAAFGVISGQVTGAGGPLGGIPIEVTDFLGDPITGSAGTPYVFTDSGGNYSVPVSGPGAYTVREAQPNFVQVSPTFNASAPTAQPPSPTLTPVPNTIASPGPGNYNYNNQPNWVTGSAFAPFESPINLTGPTTDLSKVLSINYGGGPSSPTSVQNTGAQFKFNYPSSGPQDFVTSGGTTYNLQQFHFHMPAENQVNGTNYSLELHFVNASAGGGETVVGVFAQNNGVHNNALDPVIANLTNLASQTNIAAPGTVTTGITPISLTSLLPSNTQGYYYYGSLTTPPLSIGVNWYLFSTPISMDQGQFNALVSLESGALFYPNNRAIQPNNGRFLNEVDYNLNLTSTSPSFTAANFQIAVPEPSSWVLTGLGVAGLTGFATRRRPSA